MFNGHGLYTEEGRDSGQRYQLGNDSLSLGASPSMCTAKMLPLPETQSGHLTNETHWMYGGSRGKRSFHTEQALLRRDWKEENEELERAAI